MSRRRARRKEQYQNDQSHGIAFAFAISPIFVAGALSFVVSKLMSEPYSIFLYVPIWILAVTAIALVVLKHDWQTSHDMIDKYNLRCEKCGGPTVKTSGALRGAELPEHGISRCYNCDADLN